MGKCLFHEQADAPVDEWGRWTSGCRDDESAAERGSFLLSTPRQNTTAISMYKNSLRTLLGHSLLMEPKMPSLDQPARSPWSHLSFHPAGFWSLPQTLVGFTWLTNHLNLPVWLLSFLLIPSWAKEDVLHCPSSSLMGQDGISHQPSSENIHTNFMASTPKQGSTGERIHLIKVILILKVLRQGMKYSWFGLSYFICEHTGSENPDSIRAENQAVYWFSDCILEASSWGRSACGRSGSGPYFLWQFYMCNFID